MCKKDYIWNPATCSYEDGKYLTSFIDNSIITCDEIIEETKSVPINSNEQNATRKIKKSLFLVDFLIITIALLIAVCIYYCLIKHK